MRMCAEASEQANELELLPHTIINQPNNELSQYRFTTASKLQLLYPSLGGENRTDELIDRANRARE